MLQNANEKRNWPNDPEAYILNEVIGYGATAVVHSAFCKPRNETCAIKRINLDKCNVTMDELLKEITVMSQCHHENVVSYYTSFVVKDELWLVIELLKGGSLLDEIKRLMRLQDCKNGVLDEVTIATIMREVLKGIEYFHNNNQIHRDIKAGNILLGEDGSVQIADFGVSSWINTGGDLDRRNIRHTFVGTPCWMAPEVMEQVSGYNAKADIWSFGITCIELATGTAPYYKYPPMKVLMLTLSNDPPNLDTGAEDKDQYKNYSKVFRKMISDCLLRDPEKRPSASELLKHPFFKKAKDKKYIYQTLIQPRNSAQAANKKPPIVQAGRLHRTETGEWEWSGDENDFTGSPKKLKQQTGTDQATISSSNSNFKLDDDEDDDPGTKTTTIFGNISRSRQESSSERLSSSFQDPSSKSIDELFKNNRFQIDETESMSSKDSNFKSPSALFLALRIRNKTNELNDIKFDYSPGIDTCQGVAAELLNAGLVQPNDVEVITENLNIITQPPLKKDKYLIFALRNFTDEVPDLKTLRGYAQLTLIKIEEEGGENA